MKAASVGGASVGGASVGGASVKAVSVMAVSVKAARARGPRPGPDRGTPLPLWWLRPPTGRGRPPGVWWRWRPPEWGRPPRRRRGAGAGAGSVKAGPDRRGLRRRGGSCCRRRWRSARPGLWGSPGRRRLPGRRPVVRAARCDCVPGRMPGGRAGGRSSRPRTGRTPTPPSTGGLTGCTATGSGWTPTRRRCRSGSTRRPPREPRPGRAPRVGQAPARQVLRVRPIRVRPARAPRVRLGPVPLVGRPRGAGRCRAGGVGLGLGWRRI
jgi:hypothetical protein